MRITFSKYQGTGNDFIIIDNRLLCWEPRNDEISMLCDRHFGIGADGLMLLSEKTGYNFEMKYYNSDGHESTMCGNGGRCMIAFARSLGLLNKNVHFWAADGPHVGCTVDSQSSDMFRIKMKDTKIGRKYKDGFFLDTGSPHFVMFVRDCGKVKVVKSGRMIRYDARFAPGGTNVDFVEVQDDGLFVRSYERGVENETLSCGTGAMAAAIVAAFRNPDNPGFYHITTPGGQLKVSFDQKEALFSEVWLEGPATLVFSGEISI
jgi:diaminopimelate epimerase